MKCPSCRTADLKAKKLEEGLPANGCEKCEGALISLLYYRDWAERSVNNKEDENYDVTIDGIDDSYKTLCCPKCSRIMTKYTVSGCSGNRLDLCSSCDEAWLDGGEWELLKALHLSKNIPSILTDTWQKKVRTEISEKKRKERFTKIVGEADIEKATEIRSWINTHKNRTELLFYISQEEII